MAGSRKRKDNPSDDDDDDDDCYIPLAKVPRVLDDKDIGESNKRSSTTKKTRTKQLKFKNGTLARCARVASGSASFPNKGSRPLRALTRLVVDLWRVQSSRPLALCQWTRPIEGINDSKGLKEHELEHLFEQLTQNPRIVYAVSIVDHARIDEVNILQASMQAMAEAVAALKVKADHVLVDGNRLPTFATEVKAQAIVKGDGRVYSIAAASIIAKVTRDRIMTEMHTKWPEYGFAAHKGYPTGQHRKAIAKHGPCPIHRMTFGPLKSMVTKPQA